MAYSVVSLICPPQVHFGFGAVKRLGSEARSLGSRHAFVLTDAGVVSAGLVEPVAGALGAAGIAFTVFSQVKPNPDQGSIASAHTAYEASGADLIVGLGGGSSLDTAKAVRLLAGGGGQIADYDLLLGEQCRPIPDQLPPLVAIPTTAGTGSEATAWAVITDPGRRFKTSVGGPRLVPSVALVDPALMLGLPSALTAATGLDALSHCIESYVSTVEHPLIDQMALYGIELIGRSLRTAVAQGHDRAARYDLALAALIGGLALNGKWGGACHSAAHQLSTFAEVHHGVANALMLPHQIAHSLDAVPDRYVRVAAALGAAPTGEVREQARAAVTAVRQLSADVGLPERLSVVGVTADMIPAMAQNAYRDDSWATNPRAVSVEVFEAWYRAAL